MNAPPPPPPPPPPGGQYHAHPSLQGGPRLPPATLEELRSAAAGKKAAVQIVLVYLGIPFLLLMVCIPIGVVSNNPWALAPSVVALVVGHFWATYLVRKTLLDLDPLWKKSAKWATLGLVLGILIPVVALWFSLVVDMLAGMFFKDRKLKARFYGPKDAELVAWAAANPVQVAPPPPFTV